jgi:hypothetical protein
MNPIITGFGVFIEHSLQQAMEEAEGHWGWGTVDRKVPMLQSLIGVSKGIDAYVLEPSKREALKKIVEKELRVLHTLKQPWTFDDYNMIADYIGAGYAHPDLIRMKGGVTFLMHAVIEDGAAWFIDKLIDGGANVNLQNAKGQTALMLAASQRDGWLGVTSCGLVPRLLHAGAHVNVKDKRGWTALTYALAATPVQGLDHPVKCDILVSAGAIPSELDIKIAMAKNITVNN